ncbi:Protein disulfide-isomerase [Histomonas meleagridis]|uniref:Protein disulfide-isomerase n=1 Tax=Histomonas meleagridis TaxID=135588 RepID=UPI00355AA6EF|nr:Protein disulfide-isomerase [Histomonas meleagridis]KAH0797708.1 Protein disulfide-isomerase [Histomonas meleagridis]
MLFFGIFSVFIFSKKISKDYDAVHYMRELEFRNTIDQYDFAIVLFYQKGNKDCETALRGFRSLALKAKGRAEFISISYKSGLDVADELGVVEWPSFLSFRYGHLIDTLKGYTPQQMHHYIKSILAAKYKYVHDANEAKEVIQSNNATFVVSIPVIEQRLEKIISVITAKFHNRLKFIVLPTQEISQSLGINEFPSISIIRTQDDSITTFKGDVSKVTVKSLTDFVSQNLAPRFEFMKTIHCIKDKTFFSAIFETNNVSQTKLVKEILEKVSNDHPDTFPIRYGDINQLKRELRRINLQNFSSPIFMFIQSDNFGYKKWIFNGKPSPMALSAFFADQIRNRNPETIVHTPIVDKPRKSLLRYYDGVELRDNLEKKKNFDFIVNFVGFPCAHCDEIDNLFIETANWAKNNKVNNVLFARVNASCNDIPNVVWKNETYPYGWFFPAMNRESAFPIGKRRDLYWMVQLLVDNSSLPIDVKVMPPKPTYKPERNEDL